MKVLFIALFSAVIMHVTAQNNLLNKAYDIDEDISTASISYLKDSILYVFGDRIDTNGVHFCIVYVFEEGGDTLETLQFYNPGINLSFAPMGACERMNESILLLAGTGNFTGTNKSLSVLYKFNFDTEELYYETYGDTLINETGNFVHIYNDNIFLFSTTISPVINRYGFKIYKTDILGNMLLDTFIQSNNNRHLIINNALIDKLGYIWIGGFEATTSQFNERNYLAKFNAQLQQEFDLTIGTLSFGVTTALKELPNGDMLIFGATYNGGITITEPFIAIVDTSNQLKNFTIYSSAINPKYAHYLKAVLSVDSNTAYFLGSTSIQNNYSTHVASLSKINYITGEILSEQLYSYNDQVNNQANDFIQASDGGFYIVGSTINTAANQDAWVIKTEANIEETLSLKNQTAAVASNNITLFPNPTSSDFTIQSSSTIKSLTVYNLQGQQLLQKRYLNSNRFTVEEQLPCGVYVVKVETSEGVEVSKVLVGSDNRQWIRRSLLRRIAEE